MLDFVKNIFGGNETKDQGPELDKTQAEFKRLKESMDGKQMTAKQLIAELEDDFVQKDLMADRGLTETEAQPFLQELRDTLNPRVEAVSNKGIEAELAAIEAVIMDPNAIDTDRLDALSKDEKGASELALTIAKWTGIKVAFIAPFIGTFGQGFTGKVKETITTFADSLKGIPFIGEKAADFAKNLGVEKDKKEPTTVESKEIVVAAAITQFQTKMQSQEQPKDALAQLASGYGIDAKKAEELTKVGLTAGSQSEKIFAAAYKKTEAMNEAFRGSLLDARFEDPANFNPTQVERIITAINESIEPTQIREFLNSIKSRDDINASIDQYKIKVS